MRAFAFVGIALAVAMGVAADKDIFLPDKYEVRIDYQMPYISMVEPVHAVMDDRVGLQRLSFYDGLNLFFYNKSGYKSSSGVVETDFEILPVIDHKECFAHPQKSYRQILPDVSTFVKVEGAYAMINGVKHTKWELRQSELNTTSNMLGDYEIYADAETGLISKYKFLGHNTLFGGSHSDEYVVDYHDWVVEDIDYKWFEMPEGFTFEDCVGGGARPGPQELHAYRDPREDLVSMFPENLKQRIDAFDEYKRTFNKEYTDEVEHAKRHLEFHWNLRFINAHNRKGKSFWLAVNHLADMTREELKALTGYPRDDPEGEESRKNADHLHVPSMAEAELPDAINWTEKGAVTRVKDQGSCGSCWSFGTTGAIEGQLFKKTGHLVRLSQQELMDCSWKFLNKACNGGTDSRSYQWMLNTTGGTIATEDSYGPYMNAAGWCHWDKADRGARISGYVVVPPNDPHAFNDALTNVGPLSVSIDATNPTFYYYAGGLYDDLKCGHSADHIVLATGYKTVNGQRYTIVKNSWSVHWGTSGYILVTQKENTCGIMTDPTYPLMADDQPTASNNREALGLPIKGTLGVRKLLE